MIFTTTKKKSVVITFSNVTIGGCETKKNHTQFDDEMIADIQVNIFHEILQERKGNNVLNEENAENDNWSLRPAEWRMRNE